MRFEPAYLSLSSSGQLKDRVAKAYSRLHACDICPRRCGVDRNAGHRGICRTGERAVISSFGAHFGEESSLVGVGGSGAIFFSWCNLECQYCQNHETSQLGQGHEMDPQQLAGIMLGLQKRGCHNINLVSPSHVVPQILAAIDLAASQGLRLPLVYNSGGYDSLPTLELLDGVIDIYLPDMKYADTDIAKRLSHVDNYPEVNRAAVAEMHRQVGVLRMSRRGIALRGLLVRHLVLPERLAGTAVIMRWIAEQVSPDTYVNIMDQYRPCYRANDYPPMNRPVSRAEHHEGLDLARSAGLKRIDEA